LKKNLHASLRSGSIFFSKTLYDKDTELTKA
jgi:hypothetical protein